MDPALVALTGIAAAGFVYAWRQHQRDLEAAHRLADQLGFIVDRGTRLVGTVDGLEVAVDDDQGVAMCDVGLECTLPRGLGLRPQHVGHTAVDFLTDIEPKVGDTEIDDALWLEGPGFSAERVFSHPAVVKALRAVLRAKAHPVLQGGRLRVARTGHHLQIGPALVAVAVPLARALGRACQPWHSFASKGGLAIDPDGERISGVIQGVEIEVRMAHSPTTTLCIAKLPRPLPAKTRLVRAPAPGPTLRLGDPVLDSALHITSAEPDAVGARLLHDDVRAPLLAVIHGRPGSTVDTQQVVAMEAGRSHHPDGLVDDVVALCLALKES